jgi:hypothetical protein
LLLAGRRGLALETADGDALLGDGRGDVLGVLPEGELDHAHDQQQQERGGDDQLGRDRAAEDAVGRVGRGPRAAGRSLPSAPTAGGGGGDVVGRGDDLGDDDPYRGERQAANSAVTMTASVE